MTMVVVLESTGRSTGSKGRLATEETTIPANVVVASVTEPRLIAGVPYGPRAFHRVEKVDTKTTIGGCHCRGAATGCWDP
jgi:hypothetical protein